MRSINPIFKTEKIKSFIFNLIQTHHYDCFADLSYSDKCTLAGLLIQASGKESEHECITDSPDLDKLMNALKKSLLGINSAHNYHEHKSLIFTLKDMAIDYFKNTMEALFTEYCDNYNADYFDDKKYNGKNNSYYQHMDCL